MKKLGSYLSAVVMMSAVNLAYANHHGEHGGHDGAKCEGMGNADFSISGLDTDKNKLITLQEYLAGDQTNTEKTFKHMDANSDGVLDAEEQLEIEAVYKAIHLKHKSKTTTM
jgi:hypothetical protein